MLNLTDLKQDYVSIYYNAGLRAVVNTTSQNLTRELATPESGAKQLGSKTPKHFGKIFTLTLSTGKTKRTSKRGPLAGQTSDLQNSLLERAVLK